MSRSPSLFSSNTVGTTSFGNAASPSLSTSGMSTSTATPLKKSCRSRISLIVSKCKGLYSIMCLFIFTTFVFTLYAVFCLPFARYSRKWQGMGQEMVQRTWVYMLISLCTFCAPYSLINITVPDDDPEMLEKVLKKVILERREDLWNRINPSQKTDLFFGEEIESSITKRDKDNDGADGADGSDEEIPKTTTTITSRKRDVIICNHQIYLDWIYIWSFMRQLNRHGSTKIIAKHSLQKIPIIGWGMRMMNFIFLHRNWARDSRKLGRRLRRLIWSSTLTRKDTVAVVVDEPVSLVVYPEGTTFCADMLRKSKSYLKKMGSQLPVKRHPRYTLLPRVTGLNFILKEIGKDIDGVFDLTVAYDGTDRNAGNDIDNGGDGDLSELNKQQQQQQQQPPPTPNLLPTHHKALFPEQIWGAYRLFMMGEAPPVVHIHLKYEPISGIPFTPKDPRLPLTPDLALFSSASLSDGEEGVASAIGVTDGSGCGGESSGSGGLEVKKIEKTSTTTGTGPKDDDPLFSAWLYKRFEEKDVLLKEFYETGKFPGKARCSIPLGDPLFGVVVATTSTILAIGALFVLFCIFYQVSIYLCVGFISLMALL